MDEGTLDALKRSIVAWQEKAAAYSLEGLTIGRTSCPLCDRFNTSTGLEDSCGGCPVSERTGNPYCRGTPYDKARVAYHEGAIGDFRVAAQEEVAFLKSLLPEGEQMESPYFSSRYFNKGTPTGCFDKNGVEVCVGHRVRYNSASEWTKKEYWNPEYIVIWQAPMFTLKHVGGGKDGRDHLFVLKYGGANGDLEVIG
jgi:hypothetical protein